MTSHETLKGRGKRSRNPLVARIIELHDNGRCRIRASKGALEQVELLLGPEQRLDDDARPRIAAGSLLKGEVIDVVGGLGVWSLGGGATVSPWRGDWWRGPTGWVADGGRGRIVGDGGRGRNGGRGWMP